jgi:hypothetical protein
MKISRAFLLCLTAALAPAATLDFEGVPTFGNVGNFYAALGVTFTNAVALEKNNGLSPFFPPHSGFQVATNEPDDTPLVIDFSTPVNSFSGFFTHLDTITFQFYDKNLMLVATRFSSTGDNSLGNGGTGNEAFGFNYGPGIARVKLSTSLLADSLTIDDLTFNPIPEPASLTLLAAGLVALAALSRAR